MNKREFLIHERIRKLTALRLLIFGFVLFSSTAFAQNAYIRVNQIGYLASDAKKAIAFSKTPLEDD